VYIVAQSAGFAVGCDHLKRITGPGRAVFFNALFALVTTAAAHRRCVAAWRAGAAFAASAGHTRTLRFVGA
jgi:hypothetical protein